MRFAFLIIVALLGFSIFSPSAGADPSSVLPPLTSTGAGPVIGGGGASGIPPQLFSFGTPNVQEVDGSDAAQFITAAAGLTDRDLAGVFLPLQRALGCQVNNAGFGARAYRRADGQWGGAMLVIAKSTVPNLDVLVSCVKSAWRRATAGTETSMCNSGWSYPPYSDTRHGEGYFVLLSGTASDFCSALNAKYRSSASAWPV